MVLSPKLLGAIYVAIGIFLAANKHYFQNLDTPKLVLSAVIAILLWPLLLLGIDLHMKRAATGRRAFPLAAAVLDAERRA